MREHHARHMIHGDHHEGMMHGMCGCGGRRFLSKKERIDMLEEYSESLKSELEGVEEELKELRAE